MFSYSPRPGTAARRIAAEVPREVVRARSRRLHDVDRRLRARFGARFVGREVDVLFEERKTDGCWVGLTDNYLRVAVAASSESDLTNRMRRVGIEHWDGTRCRGHLSSASRATMGAA